MVTLDQLRTADDEITKVVNQIDASAALPERRDLLVRRLSDLESEFEIAAARYVRQALSHPKESS